MMHKLHLKKAQFSKKELIMKAIKVFLVIAFLAAVFYPVPKATEKNYAIATAKDPHEHVGTKTFCHNTSSRDCDSDVY